MTHLELHLGQHLRRRTSKNMTSAAAAAAVRAPNGKRKHDNANQDAVADEMETKST